MVVLDFVKADSSHFQMVRIPQGNTSKYNNDEEHKGIHTWTLVYQFQTT